MTENILKKKYDYQFVIVPREVINSTSLSWKAKGLLAYLLDKPDNWNFTVSGICAQGKDQETSVTSGLEELEKHGYLKRIQMRDPITKRYNGLEWHITPFSNNFSETGFSGSGSPRSGKTGTSNTQDLSDPKKDSREVTPQFSFSWKDNNFIKMTLKEYEDLIADHGDLVLKEVMQEITDHIASGGKPPKKNYAAYIRNWIRKDKKWNGNREKFSGKTNNSDVIKRRKEWSMNNQWNAPAGSASADDSSYVIISGSKQEIYPYSKDLEFWTQKGL